MMDLDQAAVEAVSEVLRDLRRGIHTHDFEFQARAVYPIIAASVARATADAIADDEREGIYAEIHSERIRAHKKHGDTSMESAPAHDPTGRRYRILCEEVGEVAREFNDAEHDQRPVNLALLRKELIQVATMAAAWADRIPPFLDSQAQTTTEDGQ